MARSREEEGIEGMAPIQALDVVLLVSFAVNPPPPPLGDVVRRGGCCIMCINPPVRA